VFWQIVFALVSLLVTFTLFAIVYRFMPNAQVAVRDVIPGAVIAGLLWEGAKYVLCLEPELPGLQPDLRLGRRRSCRPGLGLCV